MKKLRFYSFIKTLLGPVLKCTMRVTVKNGELEYKGEDGLLVCSNHINMFDCILLALAYDNRQIHYLAKKELFSIPLLSQLISSLGAYGVDRASADVGAVKKSIKLLSDGDTVGIFPQGTRHPGKDIESTSFKNGAAMAAYHAHVGIQPLYIKTKNRRYRFLRKKEVIFGDYISWEELGYRDGEHADYSRATALIKERILALDKNNP